MENAKEVLKKTQGHFWLQINKFAKNAVGTTWGWVILILLLALVVLL